MSVIESFQVRVDRCHEAREAFPCCSNRRRTYTKHNRRPSMRFDPDWTMAECNACGAVLTVGDYWGHDVLDADRALWVWQGRDL